MSSENSRITKIYDLLEQAYAKRSYNIKESILLGNKALALSRETEDTMLIGKCLSRLGLFYMISTEHSLSLEMSKEALRHFQDGGYEHGIADAKYNIASVHYRTNNFHLGMFHLIDCLDAYRNLEDKPAESRTLKSLGTIYELLGDNKSAIKTYNLALEVAESIGNKDLASNVYNPLSGMLLKMGEIDEAIDLINKSVALKIETGDRRGYAFAIYGLGKVNLHLKNYDEAFKQFNEALKIHEEAGDSFGIGMTYVKLGTLYSETNRIDKAIETFKSTIAFSEESNLSLMKYKCFHKLYLIYKDLGDTTQSLYYLENYLTEKDDAVNSRTLKVIANYERILSMQSREKDKKIAQAQEIARVKQEFLSAMSHEIRTPLNAVTSIISLLKERSDDEEKKLLTSLQFSSKNLMRIINNILDFSKLDSDKMALELHSCDLTKLLNNIKDTYVGLAMEKGINLDLVASNSLANAYYLDETKLFQIIGNLISNAIKFTKIGNVTIYATHKESIGNKDIISFKITDTGSGIKEEDCKRLFESFFMPISVSKRQYGGTGLGLAIVKKLITLHDSTIEVESEPGKGSTFSFDLQLERSLEIGISFEEQAFNLYGRTAIVAEDNEINALVMSKLLKKWGIEMKHAKDGNEAVQLAQINQVDFILMDIHMPQKNGFEATQIIKTTTNPNTTTPVFALTADVTAPNNPEYIELFEAFLWKPIQVEMLQKTLNQAVVKKLLELAVK